eukprot:13448403-Alexandrium_andersonii.AAC.1
MHCPALAGSLPSRGRSCMLFFWPLLPGGEWQGATCMAARPALPCPGRIARPSWEALCALP